MKKFTKFGLFFLVAAIAFFGMTCKKADTGNPEDIEVATGIMTSILTDMFTTSFAGGANSALAQGTGGSCQYQKLHLNLNAAPSCFVNPSPGHGWYSGWYTLTTQKNCNIDEGLMSTCNCMLGAKYITGENVNGILNIDGDGHLVYTTLGINIRISIRTGPEGLVINGHTYTVSVSCTMWGTVNGGSISIKGHIGDEEINYSSTY